MAILYVGAKHGTSQQRANAVSRLGYEVQHVSPYEALPKFWSLWLHRAGGPGIDRLVERWIAKKVKGLTFDLAIVDCGDVVGPRSLRQIRQVAPKVGSYCSDNPFIDPPPERLRWSLYRSSMDQYDVVVTLAREGVEGAMRSKGIRNPMPHWETSDEVLHRHEPLLPQEVGMWGSEVVFVGTWMPGRDTFISELDRRGVPVSVFGPRWGKAPTYRQIAHFTHDRYLDGEDYRRTIAGAKVGLVLLNGANLDWHTGRSVEIPAIGTAMVAPRTRHHQQLYEDGKEALFFDAIDECIDQCKRLISDEDLRLRIASAGRARAVHNRNFNEVLMQEFIDKIVSVVA